MSSDLLVYVGSAALALWGVSHLAPTRAVADSFGAISRDSRRILVMEWVAEGIAHVAIAAVAVAVVAFEAGSAAALVERILAGALVALAVLTALTGARTPVVWFKVCPFVLTGVAALFSVASFL